MATSTPQPPLTPEERLYKEQVERYERLKLNVAIGAAVGFPLLIVMPPRKLDFYTMALGIGTYMAVDHLLEHYTSQGILWHALVRTKGIPDAENENEQRAKLARAREAAREGERKDKTMWQKIYYGDENPETWKADRMEEERRNEAEGKSISEAIFEQVWEVWNWDKKKEMEEKGDEERK
jgi:hypothetical protein